MTLIVLFVLGNVHSWCMELAFKVVTGGPFGVYDLFVRNRTHNTKNRAAQQLTNQVKEHYKSDVLDDIHSNGVTKVIQFFSFLSKLIHYYKSVFKSWRIYIFKCLYGNNICYIIIPLNIFQVRVSYYSGGAEAQYFVFDAEGATKTNWFSRNRLLETSYDIAALTTALGKFGEFFSIEG